MTIHIYSRYRKTIPLNSSARPRGMTLSTSDLPATIFIEFLSQLWVGIPFCLKNLECLKLKYASKIKNNFFQKTEVEVFEIENNV